MTYPRHPELDSGSKLDSSAVKINNANIKVLHKVEQYRVGDELDLLLSRPLGNIILRYYINKVHLDLSAIVGGTTDDLLYPTTLKSAIDLWDEMILHA